MTIATSILLSQAAALPLVSITAWEGLIDKAHIREGQKVLVHGATGGVGHIGIQLAKWKGAKVYATASTAEKMGIGLNLGADYAINYKEETVEQYVEKYTDGRGFDVVFDTVGGDNINRSLEATRMNGAVISLAVSHMPNTTIGLPKIIENGISLHGVVMTIPLVFNAGRAHHGEILSKIAQLAENGTVKPLIDPREFTFDKVAEAHQHASSGRQIGKVVLVHPAN